MNYGRFFRLNQSLSKVVDGVAIYDYIELPAYFGPSEENRMSPKYPISLTITSNSVRFRLHYSVYKIENQRESIYGYSVEDIKIATGGSTLGMKMAHMEEVIFELPFRNDATDILTSTIKELYSTKFPQRIDNNGESIGNSSGGRFLEKLIRKRFPANNQSKAHLLEKKMYESMQSAMDTLPSYSSLWLMDLIRKDENKVFIDLYDKEGGERKKESKKDISGFLRKLLLDFLFDLKHSNLFQISRNYDQMHSGLMSNFYFSALMHKCEYYYYRKIIREALEKIEEGEKNEKETIATLYAEELFRAEELWVKDIMSPQAEEHFEYHNTSKHKYSRELTETYDFSCWPSWFAEPEEEMRRVCFTMKGKSSDTKGQVTKRHICNADILAEWLNLKELDLEGRSIVHKMIDSRDKTKRQISQWFLKRYDFNDVFHLHLYKHANPILFAILLLWIVSLFWGVRVDIGMLSALGLVFITNLFQLGSFYSCRKDLLSEKRNGVIRKKIIRSRNVSLALLIFLGIGFLYNGFKEQYLGKAANWFISLYENTPKCIIFIALIMILSALYVTLPSRERIKGRAIRWLQLFPSRTESRMQHVMANLHLLLPRLVASITASWITLSMGFDLYVAFFDATPAIATIGVLLAILLLFVMYEINRVTPNSNSWLKLYRSVELITISYTISLIVGFVVINFLGERYLEKGGYVGEGDFYKQYVMEGGNLFHIDKNHNVYILGKNIEEDNFKRNVHMLDSVYHGTQVSSKKINYSSYPLVEHVNIFGGDVLILRNFLIMFAFIAMFMGIFIQLIIFGDNKQMTEL